MLADAGDQVALAVAVAAVGASRAQPVGLGEAPHEPPQVHRPVLEPRHRRLLPRAFCRTLRCGLRPFQESVMSQFQILGRRPFPFKAVSTCFAYTSFPTRSCIRTNNAVEQLSREIRRRARVVDTFPNGEIRANDSARLPDEARRRQQMGFPPIPERVSTHEVAVPAAS